MPQPGFELTSVELAPLLWDLNSRQLYRLSYGKHGCIIKLYHSSIHLSCIICVTIESFIGLEPLH